MDSRVQVVAVVAAAALLILVLELVRRRRFLERYALLWMGAALLLLVLGVWSGALNLIADAVGITTPSNALFVIAFGFVLLLLLHFSLVASSLADQSKVLAQRVALLQEELRQLATTREEGLDGGKGLDVPAQAPGDRLRSNRDPAPSPENDE